MKIQDNGTAVPEASDILLFDMLSIGRQIVVYQDTSGVMHTIDHHGQHHSGAKDTVLAVFEACLTSDKKGSPRQPFSNEIRRLMKTPQSSGPISGEAIAQRMMKICGCNGRRDCDCVSVQNMATRELWSEHNIAVVANPLN